MSNLYAVAAAIQATTQDLRLLNDELELDAALRQIGVEPLGEVRVGRHIIGCDVVLKFQPQVVWKLKAISNTLNGCLLESGGILCVADNDDWMLAELVNDPMHSDQSAYAKSGVRRSWAGD